MPMKKTWNAFVDFVNKVKLDFKIKSSKAFCLFKASI